MLDVKLYMIVLYNIQYRISVQYKICMCTFQKVLIKFGKYQFKHSVGAETMCFFKIY